MAEAVQLVSSFHPDDAPAGGGLIGDVDVEFTHTRWGESDYGGRVDPDGNPITSLALFSDLRLTNPTDIEQYEAILGGDTIPQFWSAGSLKDFKPNPKDKGATLIRAGSAETIRKSTNAMELITSLANAGLPVETLRASDFAVRLDGLRAHVIRKPIKREGLGNKEREAKYGPPSVMVVQKIIALPGELTRGAPVGKAAGRTAAAAEKTDTGRSSDGLEDYADVLLAIFTAEKADKIPLTDVPGSVWRSVRKSKDIKDPQGFSRKFKDRDFLAEVVAASGGNLEIHKDQLVKV